MSGARVRATRKGTARRRDDILREVLAGNGEISELAARFGISVSTVRRDLQQLAGDGHIHRTYGGAVAGGRSAELTLDEKESGNRAQKDAIARAAAERVCEGDVILIDAGTTTGRLARALKGRGGLTVVTNSTIALGHLAEEQGIELVVLGGRVRRPNGAILGPEGEETLRRLTPDLVFLGADGLHARDGLSCPSLEQAHSKELMAARGREAVVLADSSKLGGSPFPYHARPGGRWTLMTDEDADPGEVSRFAADGTCEVVTVSVTAAA
ncbi:DeoR/GlpR family DNA-binding transcription regulator [Streptomyces marispadix]|uniref:DeoR/GlpR family DNA-binding transcription regulator n=1 Tax=Streptomyces marispadix TaxID=2922868 RepID=A0ABS9T339_9ACTN|nr:DeoR/GlpR family DNA-binding transcription regulator [Streptomyces marispadix]MCH6162940.1 DeoR/GlpR family DNA-binding transcription regulator [Streptomyces marispadix]